MVPRTQDAANQDLGPTGQPPQSAGEKAKPLHGGEASLILPKLNIAKFMGIPGPILLYVGLLVSALGLGFGMRIYSQLKNLPVHKSMLEISDMIYETCKTYLITQGRFIIFLWVFIAIVVGFYFGKLSRVYRPHDPR